MMCMCVKAGAGTEGLQFSGTVAVLCCSRSDLPI